VIEATALLRGGADASRIAWKGLSFPQLLALNLSLCIALLRLPTRALLDLSILIFISFPLREGHPFFSSVDSNV
jgi:hypothetical protein